MTDKQSSGFSKLASQSVHDVPAHSIVPAIPNGLLSQWVVNSAAFSHTVNADLKDSSQAWSHEQFCNSSVQSGHLLIDLFGLSKAHSEAVMMHYRLLKLQNTALQAHFVVPSIKRIYQSGILKPAGLMMQTVQQFKRGRRKAVVLYNPPVIQRRDITCDSSAGLSSLFQVCLAGTQARALVDSGAETSFVDSSFVKRSGFTLQTSSQLPSIQLANGQEIKTTGHVSLPMQLPGFRGKLSALVADLSHLPCDILLGDTWLRSHQACMKYGPEGIIHLAIAKGSKKIVLKPIDKVSSGIHTLQLNALQMSRQLKPGRNVKCFVVNITSPEQNLASSAPVQHDPGLVEPSVIDAIKLEFKDVFASPPDGLPPDRGTGHLIPLEADHKAPYRSPYRLSLLEIAEVKNVMIL